MQSIIHGSMFCINAAVAVAVAAVAVAVVATIDVFWKLHLLQDYICISHEKFHVYLTK
jgi:hypothetical protein